jgi:ABC-type sugar transport system ATPase subunit
MSQPVTEPLLRTSGISKAFGHVQALDNVSFELAAGEVLALLGDNGAGKSTLIKVISGLYSPDDGEVWLDGERLEFGGPKDALEAGIATVYQDLALVETRDVAQNVFLGSEFTRGPFVDRKRCRREAAAVLRRIGIELPSVRVPVFLLSGGQRQAVAVAKTLVHGARIVILDEPTAALGVVQTKHILELIQRLRDRGLGVIVISHNLADVFEVADRVTVLRLGRIAGDFKIGDSSQEEIVAAITGAEFGGGPERPTEEAPL